MAEPRAPVPDNAREEAVRGSVSGAIDSLLGACVERKLGDSASEASYVSQLKNRYPDSAEARAIPPGACE